MRAAVGHATDTALVSDDLLDLCMDEARREINKQFPLYGASYFETVADQYAYTVALPAGATGIVKALWRGADCVLDEYSAIYNNVHEWYLSFSDFIPPNATASQRYGLIMADLQQRSWLDSLRNANARVQWPNTVWLSPQPDTTGLRVYYFYQVDRFDTVDEVSDEFVPAYWAYAKKQLHEALAAGVGGTYDVLSDTGMRIKTRAPEHHLKLANKLHKDFLDRLPPIPPFKGFV